MKEFDRLKDWYAFHGHMDVYLEAPIKKYGAEQQMNDFLHYTDLRTMFWNILKYALRLWLGHGKEHDLEKIAHYAQMAWTLKEYKQIDAPFIKVEKGSVWE